MLGDGRVTTAPTLDARTLGEIQECYRLLLEREGRGFGIIRIRVVNAGSSQEHHFVSLDGLEKKTK